MAKNGPNSKKVMPKMSSYVQLPCFLSDLSIQISLRPFSSDISHGLALMWHTFKRCGQTKCVTFTLVRVNQIYKLYSPPHDPFCEVTFNYPFFHWHNPNTFFTHPRQSSFHHPPLARSQGWGPSHWSSCVYCTVTWFCFTLFHGTAVLICTITL